MAENTSEQNFCLLNGKKFENADISEAQCFFANVTWFLYNIHFAYICFAFLFIIIIISIFGKIKADYKWFILNQAIWDLAITFSYMQNDGIYTFAKTGEISIFTQTLTLDAYTIEFFEDIIDTNPFTSLLLLSWSRFLALYFSNFYDRITDKKRVFIIIIGFNLIVIFFHSSAFFHFFLQGTRTRLNLYCRKNKLSDNCTKWYESEPLYIFLSYLYGIFRFSVLLKPVLFLCLSIFAAIMILTKIGKQANYQLKHNRKDFYISLRVASVIVFQTAINSILVFLEFTESIDDIFLDVFKVHLEKHKECSTEWNFYYGAVACVDSLQLPEWLDDDDMEFGLEGPTVYPAVKQLRIFLESIIIIAVMAGYREVITKFFKYFYRLFKKPVRVSPNNSLLFVSRASVAANAS